jgi:hypothetical protein
MTESIIDDLFRGGRVSVSDSRAKRTPQGGAELGTCCLGSFATGNNVRLRFQVQSEADVYSYMIPRWATCYCMYLDTKPVHLKSFLLPFLQDLLYSTLQDIYLGLWYGAKTCLHLRLMKNTI